MKIIIYKDHRYDIDFSSLVWNIVFWRTVFSGVAQLLFHTERAATVANILTLGISLFLYGFALISRRVRLYTYKSYLIIIIYLIAFISQIIINPNEKLFEYFIFFLKYVLLPVAALISIQNVDRFLDYYFFFTVITFVLLGFQPVLGNKIFSNYMDYGFNLILPCGVGLFFYRKIKHKFWFLPLEIVCYLFSIIYSNRSTVLTLLFMIVVFDFFIEEKSIKKSIGIICLIILAVIVYANISQILTWFLYISMNKFGYANVALNKTISYLKGIKVSFDSGRIEMYKDAIHVLSINILMGMGIGGYDSLYGYSHNIVLDFGLSWGIIGLFLFALVFIYSIIVVVRVPKGSEKYFLIILFLLWFPKLLFSSTFTYDTAFWSYVSVAVLFGFDKLYVFEK